MPLVTTPLVDEHNPCYCPTTSARVYLDRLRAKRSPALSSDALYADALHRSLAFDLRSDFDLHPDFPLASSSPRRSFAILDDSFSTLTSLSPSSASSSESSGLSPPAHARSSLVIDDASYELDGRASPIPTFFPAHTGHSPSPPPAPTPAITRALEDALYGPHLGPETPAALHALIARLCALLPGIRLHDRLHGLQKLSHQTILDALGADGLISDRVLELFRRSEVWRVDLSSSFTSENGLELAGADTLKVLAKPHSFQCLTELDLSDAPLSDYDLTHIHHLPRLSTLLLNAAGIGNEAVFHLLALRHTLSFLHLEDNPRITDDAAPALVLLGKLRFLSLVGTGLHMPGLRRFALHTPARVALIIPAACEAYLTRLPPRVASSDPATMGVAALRKALAAHGANAGGGKAEMVERLTEVLATLDEDWAVRAMLWGESEGDTNEEDEEMVDADADQSMPRSSL